MQIASITHRDIMLRSHVCCRQRPYETMSLHFLSIGKVWELVWPVYVPTNYSNKLEEKETVTFFAEIELILIDRLHSPIIQASTRIQVVVLSNLLQAIGY